jgi:hypothetical protein
MRRIRHLVGLVVLAAVGLGGCAATESQVRPPKPPEEFKAPPDESRYSGPVEYPRETMNQDPLLKRAKDSASKSTPGPTGNPRNGMGGMGSPGRMPGM